MGIFDFLKKEKKSVPAVAVVNEQTRNGVHKSYFPKFLFKPPFGWPRYVDIPAIRRLASSPYVEMCISTIIDEACSIEWDIVAKEGKEESAEEHIKQVKAFYDNPNTNKESFEQIRRKYIRDILEIDSGVINKIFNMKEEMVEISVRDGGMFTKNPDIYGFYTDREDILLQPEISSSKTPTSEIGDPGFITAADAREKAAYFQYGWNNARPVPFGKREIVWLERNGRSDNLYGRSPVQNLAETIQTLIYAIENNLEYFNDNSIPKGILGLEGGDATEILAFKEQWIEQQRKKDSAGNWKKDFYNVPIVGKVPKFERLQFSNAELELLEGQKWWAKLVWAMFGVTATELGYTEEAKGMGNQIVQSNVFRKRAIYPLLRLEEYAHNQEIISEFEFDDVEFKFMLFDVDEETKKAQLYQVQLNAGYKSINEVRLEEGMDEVEWGEKQSAEETMQMQSQYSNPWENGAMNKENSDKKRDSEKQKEAMGKEKKDIEGKPGMGHSDKWWDMYHELIKQGHSEESAAKITNSKIQEKAWDINPLILRPNETMDDDRLEKSIVYVLKENEAKIKSLIEKEVGQNKIQEIKSLEGIIKAIKSILSFAGLKTISDAVINQTFMKGWDSAERQMERNLMLNKGAVSFIQDYTFANIKGMTEEIMNDLRRELEMGIMGNEGIAKIKARVSSVFDVGENRAQMIARTETNRAENQGKLQAFKSSGVKLKKQWNTHFDDRTSPICKRLDGQTIGINENFKDKTSGWEGPCPPSHVNCRSSVLYITDEEIKEQEKRKLAMKMMEKEIEEKEITLEEKRQNLINMITDLKSKEKRMQLDEKQEKLLKRKEDLLKRLENDQNAGN